MVEPIVIPLGWRPMWELPAPGRKRKFLFRTPAGDMPSEMPHCNWGGTILSPIAWMYA